MRSVSARHCSRSSSCCPSPIHPSLERLLSMQDCRAAMRMISGRRRWHDPNASCPCVPSLPCLLCAFLSHIHPPCLLYLLNSHPSCPPTLPQVMRPPSAMSLAASPVILSPHLSETELVCWASHAARLPCLPYHPVGDLTCHQVCPFHASFGPRCLPQLPHLSCLRSLLDVSGYGWRPGC